MVVERLMTSAPEWVWRLVTWGCVVAGVLIAMLTDPIYHRLKSPSANLVISTLIIAIAAAMVGGTTWYLAVVPSAPNSSPTAKPMPSPREEPAVLNPITINPLPSQNKPPFPITFEVKTTSEIRSINSVVFADQIYTEGYGLQSDNKIRPSFFFPRLLPGETMRHTTNNPVDIGTIHDAVITIAIDFYITGQIGTWLASQQFRLDQELLGKDRIPGRLRWEPISPIKFGRKGRG